MGLGGATSPYAKERGDFARPRGTIRSCIRCVGPARTKPASVDGAILLSWHQHQMLPGSHGLSFRNRIQAAQVPDWGEEGVPLSQRRTAGDTKKQEAVRKKERWDRFIEYGPPLGLLLVVLVAFVLRQFGVVKIK